jgi:transposase
MQDEAPRPAQAAIRIDLGAIFISLELSRSSWVITSLSPGAGEKMSKHSVAAGNVAGLLERFSHPLHVPSRPTLIASARHPHTTY